jgi:protein-tyrosine phosphatase
MNAKTSSHPINNSYWVIPEHFRAGEYPGSILDHEAKAKLRWLIEQRIDYFLDLTEAGESGLKPYIHLLEEVSSQYQSVVMHKRISIRDLSTPSTEEMLQILDTIDVSLSEGHNIYIHCYGGKGRTGTVVGCYLTRHGMPGSEALEWIKMLRKNIHGDAGRSPETESQRRMVLEWTVGK